MEDAPPGPRTAWPRRQSLWWLMVGLGSGPAAAQTVEPPAPAARDVTLAGGDLGAVLPVGAGGELTLRGGYFAGDLEIGYAQADLQFAIAGNVTVGPGYFGLFQPGTPERPSPRDHRARASVNVRLPVGRGALVVHRSLVEYRFRERASGWRYRPLVRLEGPVRLGRREVVPYVQAEPFFDFDLDRVTRTPVQVGMRVPVAGGFALQPYYQHEFASVGGDADIFGVGVTFRPAAR